MDDGLRALERAFAETPSAEALAELVRALRRAGRDEVARALVRDHVAREGVVGLEALGAEVLLDLVGQVAMAIADPSDPVPQLPAERFAVRLRAWQVPPALGGQVFVHRLGSGFSLASRDLRDPPHVGPIEVMPGATLVLTETTVGGDSGAGTERAVELLAPGEPRTPDTGGRLLAAFMDWDDPGPTRALLTAALERIATLADATYELGEPGLVFLD